MKRVKSEKECEWMKKFIKFINDYNGRDKFYRTIQYSFKFFVYLFTEVKDLRKGGYDKIPNFISGFEKGLSSGRKFMRIGSIPGAYLNFKNSFNEKDPILKILTVFRDSIGFFYLFLDHINWLASSAAHKAIPYNTKVKEEKKSLFLQIKIYCRHILVHWIGVGFCN